MAVINESRGSHLVPEAMIQIGRGYAMVLDHTEAVQWFERVLEQHPEHSLASEAQLYAASSYARVGKYREAVHRYKAYIAKFPEGERIDRAYLNVIDVLRDQREESEALKWADTLRTKFQGRQPAALATFAEVRIYLARRIGMELSKLSTGSTSTPILAGRPCLAGRRDRRSTFFAVTRSNICVDIPRRSMFICRSPMDATSISDGGRRSVSACWRSTRARSALSKRSLRS